MRAEEAMRIATADLIKTGANNGIVTIYRSPSSSTSGWDYHLRFVPRDSTGSLNLDGNVLVGTYTELSDAIDIAHEKYSIKGQDWTPQDQVELVENNNGALEVDGRGATDSE